MKPEIHDDATWEEWPRCPECDLRRQVTCPTCMIASRDFPLGELITQSPSIVQIEGTEQHENWEILLMCSECDEAFAPTFYRRCEQCGHEFPDGQIVVEEEPPEQLPTRVVAVILGLILLTVVAYFYFASL